MFKVLIEKVDHIVNSTNLPTFMIAYSNNLKEFETNQNRLKYFSFPRLSTKFN